ncbi:hypothetical protein [Parabacteroides sp. Marseille-P3160]|uniref:hypothetical protein n=1 Tax=Parabacteroides sp. Marseille-P3160 TaxID=1917887 RepID=UPI0009BC514F|nr:hypothetical protein [Parabacteroides sp. Marseille-P3160]
MKSKQYILLSILLFFIFSFTNDNGNNKKRKIINSLYSIELPLQWEPMKGMPGDGTIPGEREIKFFHLYYLAWSTPIRSLEDRFHTISLDIQSYQRTDGNPLSVKDVEELSLSKLNSPNIAILKKIDLKGKARQRRLVLIKNSKEMDGSIVKYRDFYLMQKNRNIVHCVNVCLREKQYHVSGTPSIIEDILDSFSIVVKTEGRKNIE